MRHGTKLLVPVAVTALALGMAACDDDDTADDSDEEAVASRSST